MPEVGRQRRRAQAGASRRASARWRRTSRPILVSPPPACAGSAADFSGLEEREFSFNAAITAARSRNSWKPIYFRATGHRQLVPKISCRSTKSATWRRRALRQRSLPTRAVPRPARRNTHQLLRHRRSPSTRSGAHFVVVSAIDNLVKWRRRAGRTEHEPPAGLPRDGRPAVKASGEAGRHVARRRRGRAAMHWPRRSRARPAAWRRSGGGSWRRGQADDALSRGARHREPLPSAVCGSLLRRRSTPS